MLWFALSPALCYASETVTTESAIQSDFAITDTEISTGLLMSRAIGIFKDTNGNSGYPSLHNFVEFTPPLTSTYQSSNLNSYWTSNKDFSIMIDFRGNTEFALFDKNTVIDLTVSGINFSYQNGYKWSVTNVGGGSGYYEESIDLSQLNRCRIILFPEYVGADGDWSASRSYEVLDSVKIDNSNNTISLIVDDLEIPFDVKFVRISFTFNAVADDLDSTKTHSGFTGWTDTGYYNVNYDEATFRYAEVDQTSGLLSGIIEWLRSIRDGIVNVKDGVANVFNAITELPSKIWTVFENGIKSLLVPSETDITAMKDKWDTLLSDRFGVVYESGALLIDIANSVSESSTTETITFPTVSYNFSGTDFTFGGYEVDVIPNGFEFLADILKGVIDIVCTLAFINAMRRKYDELMMR